MESPNFHRLYLTRIKKHFDCDTFFPPIPNNFVLTQYDNFILFYFIYFSQLSKNLLYFFFFFIDLEINIYLRAFKKKMIHNSYMKCMKGNKFLYLICKVLNSGIKLIKGETSTTFNIKLKQPNLSYIFLNVLLLVKDFFIIVSYNWI